MPLICSSMLLLLFSRSETCFLRSEISVSLIVGVGISIDLSLGSSVDEFVLCNDLSCLISYLMQRIILFCSSCCFDNSSLVSLCNLLINSFNEPRFSSMLLCFSFDSVNDFN